MSTILFLTRELPHPPNAGDRIVTGGFVRCLADAGHELHVLSFASDDDAERVRPIRERCRSVVRVPGTSSALPPMARKVARAALGRSDVMEMFYSEALSAAAARRIETLSPDVVIAQHPYIGRVFLDRPVRRAAARAGAELVTSAHVVEYAVHQLYREHAPDRRTRAELALEIPRLRRAELAVYRASDRTLVLGEEDAHRLGDAGVDSVVDQRVGLDVGEYDPAPLPDDERGSRLAFFGSYDWFPNEDGVRAFAEHVFPRIREARPAVELAVAGRGANEAIRRLGERPGVEFVGEVDDLASFVRGADVVVAPLRIGGGVRLKILESMAWRKPVVSTDRGFEGVDGEAGEDAVVATDWDEFVEGVVALLDDPGERRRLARNARRTVEERYALDAVGAELEANLGL